MKQQHQNLALAGLLALALGLSGCAATSGDQAADSAGGGMSHGASGSAGQSATGSGAAGKPGGTDASGSSGTMGTGSSGSPETTTPVEDGRTFGAAGNAVPNSTVQSIEIVPSQAAGASSSAGSASSAIGSSGAAGATGSSPSSEVYRITLRMDDGSTQVVTQDSAPGFRSGDRVSTAGGVIRR
ncbi:hypothetical protein [Massilia niastensis]|uniref:hypothetical protein n=1 Tax=Massilia niastensis TaxID=544911 RepID=UPI000360E948|nr:hypothetical protein [Massilia niastensis]